MENEYDTDACRSLAAAVLAYALSNTTIRNDFKRQNRIKQLGAHLKGFARSRGLAILCGGADLDEEEIRARLLDQAATLDKQAIFNLLR